MLFLCLLMICFILALFVIDSIKWGITPTATSRKVRETIGNIAPLLTEGVIIDCGSGFGTLAHFLKKKYPHLDVRGYEGAWIPYWISKALFSFSKPTLHFEKADFLNQNLKEASLVVCYLYPHISQKLCKKFQAQLESGTWVISHTFALEGLNLIETLRANDLYRTPVYLYQI